MFLSPRLRFERTLTTLALLIPVALVGQTTTTDADLRRGTPNGSWRSTYVAPSSRPTPKEFSPKVLHSGGFSKRREQRTGRHF